MEDLIEGIEEGGLIVLYLCGKLLILFFDLVDESSAGLRLKFDAVIFSLFHSLVE